MSTRRRSQLSSTPQIPIEDAVTVAYVSIVHARSHVTEYSGDPFEVDIDTLLDAIEDLDRAMEMLRPHCREAPLDSPWMRVSTEDKWEQ